MRNAWYSLLYLAVFLPSAQVTAADTLATTLAEQVTVPRVYRLDGVIEATNRSTVSAQTQGQVAEVLFDVDDLVQEGEVIVVIEDAEQSASMSSARANLKSAEARQAAAEKEYERIRSVYAKNAVSKAVMDNATAERKAARAAVQGAAASLTQARQQLEYTKVRAPYTGIVTERLVEPGEIASPGQRLMSGISLQQLRVDVDVPQSLISAVRRKQAAMVLIENQWLAATRVTVFPVADRASDSFRVRLDLPEGIEGIFPGMYVKVAFSVGDRTALVVPRSSVVFRSEVIGVYVVDEDGRVSLRHVRLGTPLPDGRFTILSGLDAGEAVALEPQAAVIALKEQRTERSHDE